MRIFLDLAALAGALWLAVRVINWADRILARHYIRWYHRDQARDARAAGRAEARTRHPSGRAGQAPFWAQVLAVTFRADLPGPQAAEQYARHQAGMPSGHPETLNAELDEDDEEWLAVMAAELWPHDEWTDTPGGTP